MAPQPTTCMHACMTMHAWHMHAGALMIFWAAHWLLGFVRSFYEAQARGQPFRSQSCYRFLWFPERWPMEAVVKATLPFIAIFLELYWLHSTYRWAGVPCPVLWAVWPEHCTVALLVMAVHC